MGWVGNNGLEMKIGKSFAFSTAIVVVGGLDYGQKVV